MNDKNQDDISFVQFITSQKVRKFIWLSIIGIIIVLVGVFLINDKKIAIIVNFIGAVLVFTSTDEIIKRAPKK